MRTDVQVKTQLLNFAEHDRRVRMVLLNGSKVNPNAEPDQLQDFDVIFIVSDYETFLTNHDWTNVFGEKLIWQMPEEMTIGTHSDIGFSYLMLFTDRTRIDLTLFPIEHFPSHFVFDSLTEVWLDKEGLMPALPPPTDADYHIRKPTEKEFRDVCNEFWWVSTYVAKGLVREEITYAKEMLDTTVRQMFMTMIQWQIGLQNNFLVSFGKAGKNMRRYLSPGEFEIVLATYADADIGNNWQALFLMADLFKKYAENLSRSLKFSHDRLEQVNVLEYLKQVYYENKLF